MRYCYLVTMIIGILSSMSSAFAQNPKTYELNGFMGVQGGEIFSYKLELKDSVGSTLSGFAYTFKNSTQDVKTKVVAHLDRQQKSLTVTELSIIYNHQFSSKALICLVDATLNLDAQHVLSGPLMTRTSGNDANCSSGSISFNNRQEIDAIFNPEKEKPAAPAPAPVAVKRATQQFITDTLRPEKQRQVAKPTVQAADQITEGKDKTYFWESSTIKFEIWDGTNVDNDRVSVAYNGSTVLENYSLKKEKKILELPTGGNGLNIITIEALNEGNDPPNTANITLTDGSRVYEIVAHNTIGKKAIIKIRRK